MHRLVLALGLVLFLAAALAWGVPFLTREQEYTAATPQPEPIFAKSSIPLPGGEQACVEGAVIDPQSEAARIRVFARRPMPLELTLRGRGYAATAPIPPTYTDGEPISVPVEPPPEAVATTICIRNLGREEVELYASVDRTNAQRRVTVGEQVYPQNFVISFSEREPRSIADRLPTSLDRASAFRPTSPAVLWPLLALFVFGVPLGVLGAYAWAASDRDDAERA